jgi:4-amino-4-deoxy-L-arabinose transferase-like glycosyltransferase
MFSLKDYGLVCVFLFVMLAIIATMVGTAIGAYHLFAWLIGNLAGQIAAGIVTFFSMAFWFAVSVKLDEDKAAKNKCQFKG